MPQTIQLQTGTDLKNLDRVLEWFDQVQRQPQISQCIWLQCRLAMVEAFTNAVRHAHHNLSSDVPVTIELSIFTDFLEICVWDCGSPFDLEKYVRELPEMVDCDRENGRGLLIIRNIADRLSYTRTTDRRNCLLIVKYFN